MVSNPDFCDQTLRRALEGKGQRFTEQRAAVYRFLVSTDRHPTAEEVFLGVRRRASGISLATVYKSLECLVGCGLASKLAYGDSCARYDGRTDPHLHVRCLNCGDITDLPGDLSEAQLSELRKGVSGFEVTGYRLELLGHCFVCLTDAEAPRDIAVG
jgi:Fe2+ or Zn2+ uptake regulation protein